MNHSEPLYVIVVKDGTAEHKLKHWARSSPHNRAQVEGNRLKIFDQNTWQRFCVTWAHGFEQLTAWDQWNRRHVDLR